MKKFRITYILRPEAENITMVIIADSYEDACIFAKGYRKGAFSCEEVIE